MAVGVRLMAFTAKLSDVKACGVNVCEPVRRVYEHEHAAATAKRNSSRADSQPSQTHSP